MQNLAEFLIYYAKKHNKKIAYEIKRGYRTTKYSFADILSLSLKTATFLKNLGAKKDDKIVIWAPNMPEYPILYFAAWILGLVIIPIDIRTTKETLKSFLNQAKPKIGFKGKFISEKFPSSIHHVFNLEDIIGLTKNLSELKEIPTVLPSDLAEISYTSGTTGIPKGVMLTHENFLFTIFVVCKTFPFKKTYRMLSLLPLSHIFEQVIDFLALFSVGIPAVYLERTNNVSILRALRKNGITCIAIVPQLLQILMRGIERKIEKEKKQREWEFLIRMSGMLPMSMRRILFTQLRKEFGGNLEIFGCGSAALSISLAKKWENIGIYIYEGYGATETTAILTLNTPHAKKLGSVGKILPGVELKIEPHSKEIMARGKNIMQGYFNDPKKTKQSFEGNWYRTGDVGELDKDQYLYITGRTSFRIVLQSGEKAYPEDIENKLNNHPLVEDSCVIGVKTDDGERVHAVLLTKYPEKIVQIIKSVNELLPPHEQIFEWTIWKDRDFPRTPILKIDRKKVASTIALKEQLKETGEKEHTLFHNKLFSLISQVTNAPLSKITENATLSMDLKIDSLQRVELLSLIEEAFGVAVPEADITTHTTVIQLKNLIDKSEIIPKEIPVNTGNYSDFLTNIRIVLQNILIFPLHALFAPIKIIGRENLDNLNTPAIFYFNHIGIMDGLCVLRILPIKVRKKLVIAAKRELWNEWRKPFVEFWGGGFPFDNKRDIKASLELTGEFLDKNFSILIAPEGTFSKDGELLAFKPGLGFMATHMNVPVIPIKIDQSYKDIFPTMNGSFWENFPKKRKTIWVKVGKPMTFSPETPIEEATEKMEKTLASL